MDKYLRELYWGLLHRWTPSASGNPLNWNSRKLGKCCENGMYLFCSCSSVSSYSCRWRQQQEDCWSQPVLWPLCPQHPFHVRFKGIWKKWGTNSIVSSFFKTYLGLQWDSNFIKVIRIQKVAHPQSLCLVSVSTAVGVRCLPGDVHSSPTHLGTYLFCWSPWGSVEGRMLYCICRAFQSESEVVFRHSPGVNCL